MTVVDVCVFRSGKHGINHRWLMWCVNSPQFRARIEALQSGTTRKRISRGNLATINLPVPPLAEQARIVEAIETQFSRLDVAVAALERARANLKRYRAAVLNVACSGRLVPTEAELAHQERRNYESGKELLGRLGRSGLEAHRKLPEGWWATTVEDLIATGRKCAYGVLQPGGDVPDGIPLVRVGDINEGRVEVANLKRIAPSVAEQYPRTNLVGGEVLISLVGAIGRTAVVPDLLAGANTARAVGVIPVTGEISSEWVEIWFRNPSKIAEMTDMAHEVARKTLNLEDVRSAIVLLPPVAEQERIVAEVERRLSGTERTETAIEAELRRTERLRQAILQKAFTGQLVPQDPNDEPARVLLERIRAERAKQPARVRTRRR